MTPRDLWFGLIVVIPLIWAKCEGPSLLPRIPTAATVAAVAPTPEVLVPDPGGMGGP